MENATLIYSFPPDFHYLHPLMQYASSSTPCLRRFNFRICFVFYFYFFIERVSVHFILPPWLTPLRHPSFLPHKVSIVTSTSVIFFLSSFSPSEQASVPLSFIFLRLSFSLPLTSTLWAMLFWLIVSTASPWTAFFSALFFFSRANVHSVLPLFPSPLLHSFSRLRFLCKGVMGSEAAVSEDAFPTIGLLVLFSARASTLMICYSLFSSVSAILLPGMSLPPPPASFLYLCLPGLFSVTSRPLHLTAGPFSLQTMIHLV